MPVNSDIFKYATAVRDSVTKEQQEYIKGLYVQWSENVKKQADYYSKLSIGSAEVSSQYYEQLYKQMQAQSKEIANGVYTSIKDGMATVSDAVVKDAVEWMHNFGFSKKDMNAALSYIPQSTVNSLLTGSVYGKSGSWSLSAALWGDNEKTLRDIYAIMGQGVAAQMGIKEMADLLSQYVNPNKQLSWQGPKGMKIYKKAVDYNAQRLARTLVQHTYQQSFVSATKDNPFVTEYVWLSNGPRVCPICADRDGKHYKKDKLPFDHPNGMCTMEPVVVDNLTDKLANWVNSEDGTYPEIDAFAKKFGYDASKFPKMTLADIKKQYGNTHYKIYKPWYDKLPKDVQQTVDKLVQESGLNTNAWYKQNINNAVKSAKSAAKKAANTTVKKVEKSAANDLLSFDDMIKKYAKKMSDSSKNFLYLGNMSTEKMVNSLLDDEIEDIAEWMAKKFHYDISGTTKKYETVTQWVKNAFEKYSGMSFEKQSEIAKIANGVTGGSANKFTSTAAAKVIKKNNKVSAKISKWIDEMIDSSGTYGTKTNQWIRYMKSIEEELKSDMSKDALSAIRTYSGSKYTEINAWLRSGKSVAHSSDYGVSKSLASDIKGLINELNSPKMRTTEDYVVRRGTDFGDLAGLFMDGNFSDNKWSLVGKSVDELSSMFIGQVGEYKGFTSTSSMWDRGFNGEVECVIKVPKGSSGMSILSISQYGDAEGEFLLNAGTKVICKGIEKSDGHKGSRIRVFLEVLI